MCKRKLFLIERCSFWGTTWLFVLFVNNLPDSVKNVIKLFAADLKLIADAIDKVSIENHLSSPKKCKVMHFDYNYNPILNFIEYNPNNEFKLDGIIFKSIATAKDLGLTVIHDLEWIVILNCVSKLLIYQFAGFQEIYLNVIQLF